MIDTVDRKLQKKKCREGHQNLNLIFFVSVRRVCEYVSRSKRIKKDIERKPLGLIYLGVTHRLNMEIDL
jgi:hypothetical protein